MKKKISYISTILAGSFLLFLGCVKEDHFGKSNYKEIRYFSVPQQAGNTQILTDSLLIRITVSPTADLTKLFADSIGLSSYATVSPKTGEIQDFSKPVKYIVTAENGTKSEYSVIVTRESSNPQLENGSLDDWYTPSGKNYQEPGLNDATIWATGNAGVVTLGAANVKPVTVSGTDLAAEMVTKDLGALGQLVGQRIAAGTIFTGKFVLDIANPLNSAKFGIPFTGRPVSFTVSYTYAPGSPYRNGQGQILTKNDSCDIYMLLENRENNQVKRIATGWFRNTDKVDAYKEITIPLIYGQLPQGSPVYMYPVNGSFGTGSEPVTHISFVAASSAYGALFEGGVNTRLVINNIKLNY